MNLTGQFFAGSNLSVNSGRSNGFAERPTYEPSRLPSYVVLELTIGRGSAARSSS